MFIYVSYIHTFIHSYTYIHIPVYVHIHVYSLLHLEGHFFILNPRSFLPRSAEKRPRRLRLEIENK